ncbi:transcriptional regulator [Acidianus sulfidivorans JP7]|uniref:Transcriptional regulator n=1 Tax=Acidianus sulfidivorans JP7 TaxID=619593 RepID=A0A2U9IQH9_9CREN|nr:transcriptional regulator [Acidianus sulfidivorans]AWR98282.1 transcriptional regulator [Acidianus sulfidivorans JP7]
MKWQTQCEIAYIKVVPFIRSALIKKLVEKGMPLRKASKSVGLSITSYEKHVNDKNLQLLEKNDDINDMIDALANRIYSGEKIDPITFCIICSNSRKILGLTPCNL